MAAGLRAYQLVLADPKARAFTLAGLIARLPISMTGIGIVLLVSLTTGSFGRAGLITAAGTQAPITATDGPIIRSSFRHRPVFKDSRSSSIAIGHHRTYRHRSPWCAHGQCTGHLNERWGHGAGTGD